MALLTFIGAFIGIAFALAIVSFVFTSFSLDIYALKPAFLFVTFIGPLIGVALTVLFGRVDTEAYSIQGLMSDDPVLMMLSFISISTALCVLIYIMRDSSYASIIAILCTFGLLLGERASGNASVFRPALLALYTMCVLFVIFNGNAYVDGFFAWFCDSVLSAKLLMREEFLTDDEKDLLNKPVWDAKTILEFHHKEHRYSVVADNGFFSNKIDEVNGNSTNGLLIPSVFYDGVTVTLLISSMVLLLGTFFKHQSNQMYTSNPDFAMLLDPDRRGEENLHRFLHAMQLEAIDGTKIPGANDKTFLKNISRDNTRHEQRRDLIQEAIDELKPTYENQEEHIPETTKRSVL